MTYRSLKSVHVCGLGASRSIKQKTKKLKKVYLRNHNTCFSRVRQEHPRCRSATWICMCGHTRDPVICSKFHRNTFKSFGTPGDQNLALPITLASRFYNSLYYRTSRDFKNKNWLQFLFIVKAAVLKQQISKFYPKILSTEDSFYIYERPLTEINVIASFCAEHKSV